MNGAALTGATISEGVAGCPHREVLELPVDGSVQVRPIPAEPVDAPANAQAS